MTAGVEIVPVPLSATLSGLSAALSVIEMAAVRLPDAVGVKLPLMVQLAPATRVFGLSGQVLV